VARLLLVEDDTTIGDLLASGLRGHGHEVCWSSAGRPAVDQARRRHFDLVLLDLGLPDLDGVEVCRQIRALQPATVIVMLTARRDEMDVVVGLEAGADDYLTKPFSFTVLLARVRAHLRRGGRQGATTESELVVGDLVVDTASRRGWLGRDDGGRVELVLRAKEFDLLARLAAEAGLAVSRSSLMTDVWDENWFGSTKTLDVHVAALRRRLAEAAEQGGVNAPRITTLRGHGYRLEVPE
jgi:DNA-binding response OmpR family regulator